MRTFGTAKPQPMRLCESCLMQPRCDQSDSVQSALGAQYGLDTMKQTHLSHPNACYPGRRPGIQCSAMPFANARSVHGSRIKSGMTLTIKYGLILTIKYGLILTIKSRLTLTICHPGRRPGIQCSPMTFANVRSGQWIPDQVRDDKSESIKSKAQQRP